MAVREGEGAGEGDRVLESSQQTALLHGIPLSRFPPWLLALNHGVRGDLGVVNLSLTCFLIMVFNHSSRETKGAGAEPRA